MSTLSNPLAASHSSLRRWSLSFAGPAALGAAWATKSGVAITEVARLPLLWVGVAALMVHALYIGAALSGLSPSARDVLSSAVDSLSRGGALLLGLCPALLFMVTTTDGSWVAEVLVRLCAGLGALTGLSVLFHKLCVEPDASVLARFVFLSWAAVLLGIGSQLFGLSVG